MHKAYHAVLAIFFWGVAVMLSVESAIADMCKFQEIPEFSARIDPNISPPSECLTLRGLELYRVKLELFRKNTVEGYNRQLIAYGQTLDRLDREFRRKFSQSKCTLEQYEILSGLIEEQHQKMKVEYLEPYRQGITTYSEYIDWYGKENRRLRAQKQLEATGEC